MRSLREIAAVTTLSLRGIPSRPGSSTVVVVGIAGVVSVLICVFALAVGYTEAATKTGRPDRVIVLGRGALAEAGSSLSRENVQALLDAPGIRQDRNSKPIASAESLVLVRRIDRRTGLESFATLRGVGAAAAALRPEIHLVAGRMFKSGLHEVIVGRSVQRRLVGLEIGDRFPLAQGANWTIVGVFETQGDSHESELLTDVETLNSAFQRDYFNSLTLQLDTPASFDAFKAATTSNPTLAVQAKRETVYFAEAAEPEARMLKFIAYTIGSIMAFGAVAAALNALYSAIGTRAKEIATLRAIGYGGYSVLVSVFIEALLLSFAGAALGAWFAWYFFNGSSVSTVTDVSSALVVYALHMSPGLIALAMGSACVMGLLGGLFPAIRAATLPVATVINGR